MKLSEYQSKAGTSSDGVCWSIRIFFPRIPLTTDPLMLIISCINILWCICMFGPQLQQWPPVDLEEEEETEMNLLLPGR